jgi:hypothetical protein
MWWAVTARTTPVATAIRTGMSHRGGSTTPTAGAVVLGRPGRLGRRVSAIPILSAAAVSAKVGSADQWSWERAIVAAA